eukprot:c4772_g1_i1.p1 GENE.c4772_g1_i1~~c4772_g1_i1.p1  ORF type:complete len:329 (-),score=93.35 c4772_g1_i1:17-856(-)
MYDTLKPELLTATPADRREMAADPTYVVNWDLFSHNQLPYLEVRRPFILGTNEEKWQPTLSHHFIGLLHDKGILTRLYSQNIDGLDRKVGIPEDKVVNVHGTIAAVSCEFCSTTLPLPTFCDRIKKNIKDIYNIDPTAPQESTPISCDKCDQPGLKPSTVLYGRGLPESFFRNRSEDFPKNVDLLLILGTSLIVSPANSLVAVADKKVMRVLINKEEAGLDLGLQFGGNKARDVFLEGDCDTQVRQLAEACGWLEELEARVAQYQAQKEEKNKRKKEKK